MACLRESRLAWRWIESNQRGNLARHYRLPVRLADLSGGWFGALDKRLRKRGFIRLQTQLSSLVSQPNRRAPKRFLNALLKKPVEEGDDNGRRSEGKIMRYKRRRRSFYFGLDLRLADLSLS